ncbi:MAG: hypothetical protein ACOYLS_00380 [Polymorphobacter sp.]
MSSLQHAKLLLMGFTHLGKDALHIYVGLAVLLAAALLLRWPLRRFRPLLAVLVVALAGEAWDMFDTLRAGLPLHLRGNGFDIANTLFWPLVITLLARFTPALSRR